VKLLARATQSANWFPRLLGIEPTKFHWAP